MTGVACINSLSFLTTVSMVVSLIAVCDLDINVPQHHSYVKRNYAPTVNNLANYYKRIKKSRFFCCKEAKNVLKSLLTDLNTPAEADVNLITRKKSGGKSCTAFTNIHSCVFWSHYQHY